MADNNFIIRASLDFDSDVNKIFSEKLKPRLDELEKLSNIKLKLDAGNIGDFQQSVEKIKNQFDEIQKISNQQIKVNKIDTSNLFKSIEGINLNELKSKINELKQGMNEITKISTNTGKNGNIKSAVIEYKDGIGNVVQETMKWVNVNNEAENSVKRIFKTTDLKYVENIEKAKNETDKLAQSQRKLTEQQSKKRENSEVKEKQELIRLSEQQAQAQNKAYESNINGVNKLKIELESLKTKYKDVFSQTNGNQIGEQLNKGGLFKDSGEIEKTADKIKKLKTELTELRRIEKLGDSVKIIPKDAYGDVDKLSKSIKELYGEEAKLQMLSKGVDGMGNQFQKATVSIDNGTKSASSFGVTIDKTTSSIYKNNTAMKESATHVNTFGNSMKNAFQQVMSFAGVSSIMFAVANATRNGIKSIMDLDSAMIDLKKVSNETDETYNKFMTSINRTAIEVGHSTKAAIDSTTEWKKLGYTMQEAETAAKTSLIYSNVGDLPIDKATKSLISTMKAFNIEAKDSIGIVDKFNEVGNNYSISSDVIGEALQRSASSLATSNNSLEQSIGLITAAHTVLQDQGDVSGTSIKTLSLRLRGISEESGKIIPKIREDIKSIMNVDIMKDENTFKPTFDIMKEMAAVYPSLTDKQKAYVAQLAAGKQHGASSFYI